MHIERGNRYGKITKSHKMKDITFDFDFKFALQLDDNIARL